MSELSDVERHHRVLPDPDESAMLRCVEIGSEWLVATYETSTYDRHGKEGIRVKVWEGRKLVYDTGPKPRDLVFLAPSYEAESDRAIFSAVSLICHQAQENGATWDHEGLWESNSMAECEAEEEVTNG